jgi:2,3-bisphosphoglycerate-independent phosphoglycerate mutase
MPKLSLRPLKGYQPFPGPLVTVIMDGVGLGKRDESDGVFLAYKPTLDALFQEKLYTKLKAHGKAVGLPTDEDMGNSEVGHNALGCGRVVTQGAQLVNDAVASGKIFAGKAWAEIRARARAGGTVHFIGLLSDGNVHSHIAQLYALLDRCGADGFKKVRVHPLLDGRDVGQKSALDYVLPLEKKLAELSASGRDFRVGSGGGRMVVTMDRYCANWGVVEKGWKAHVLGIGRQFPSASQAVRTYYAEDPKITDQYLDSFVVAEGGKPVGTIQDGDAVVFFNFRGDRAIEISRAFDEPDFKAFDRVRVPKVFYAGMMEYDGEAHIPRSFLVEPPAIDKVLGEYLCGSGVTSFAVSETQKFGHVTYFWNGNNSGYIDEKLEKYVEIPSDKVRFDLKPWMKSAEITDAVVEAVAGGRYKFIRLNFANADMVGHTGVAAAVRIAVESVDLGLARIGAAVEQAKGVLMVTADHGNADCLYTEKNGKRSVHVAHTLDPVPFIIKDYSGADAWKLSGVAGPGLSNVAATICNILGFEAPADYDPSLVSLR